MWWLIPIGIGCAAAIIVNGLESTAGAEVRSFESTNRRVRDEMRRQNEYLEAHQRDAQSRYEYKRLSNDHLWSVRKADEAYQELSSARHALDTIGQTLCQLKELREQLKVRKGMSQSRHEKITLDREIEEVGRYRRGMFEHKDKLKSQRDKLFVEVKRLNYNTTLLKEKKEWYESNGYGMRYIDNRYY